MSSVNGQWQEPVVVMLQLETQDAICNSLGDDGGINLPSVPF